LWNYVFIYRYQIADQNGKAAKLASDKVAGIASKCLSMMIHILYLTLNANPIFVNSNQEKVVSI
jgi:hypothetical protein